MKMGKSLAVVAAAAVVSWVLPGTHGKPTQMAHEFLTPAPSSTAMAQGQVQPVQLAVLFQNVDR